MQEPIRICPNCGAEFFAHIQMCNVCEIALIAPETYNEVTGAIEDTSFDGTFKDDPSPADTLINKDLTGELACVETGKLAYLSALTPILKKAGIPYELVETEGGAGASSCGKKTLADIPSEILVEIGDEAAALKALEDYMHTLHPEMAESKERLDSGLCPACNSETMGADECPDCGLNLSGMGGDDDCSSC